MKKTLTCVDLVSQIRGSCILGTSFFIIVCIAVGTFLQKGTKGVVATSLRFATVCWALVSTLVDKAAMNLALMERMASRGRQTQIVVRAKMRNCRVQW